MGTKGDTHDQEPILSFWIRRERSESAKGHDALLAEGLPAEGVTHKTTPNDPETNCCCKHMAEVEHGVETIIQNFEAKVVRPEVAALDLSRKGVLLKELEEALMHVEEATSAQTRTESTEGVSECRRSERPKNIEQVGLTHRRG